MAKLLALTHLRGKKFTLEFRSPFLRQFGLRICSPEHYNQVWRAWSDPPTRAERKEIHWREPVTLCVMCKLACGGCTWSDGLEPVQGWQATPKYINGTGLSYFVSFCPEFMPGRRPSNNASEMSTDGCVRLMERMMEIAQEDYILGSKHSRVNIERWLTNSQWLENPDDAIRGLRDKARIGDLHPELRRKMLLKGGLKGGETE